MSKPHYICGSFEETVEIVAYDKWQAPYTRLVQVRVHWGYQIPKRFAHYPVTQLSAYVFRHNRWIDLHNSIAPLGQFSESIEPLLNRASELALDSYLRRDIVRERTE